MLVKRAPGAAPAQTPLAQPLAWAFPAQVRQDAWLRPCCGAGAPSLSEHAWSRGEGLGYPWTKASQIIGGGK